jgi:DNA-binding GntR family transcriptional regulator
VSGPAEATGDPQLSLARRSQTTLVDDVVDAIRDRIVRGDLAPGVKINQQAVAEMLGVSRTPLREAFQRLGADGWVSLHARRGAEVRPLTVDEADEIFTMRVLLETAAARLAATAHTETDARRALELLTPAPPADTVAFGIDGANQSFHRLVYGLDAGILPRELEASVRRYFARALRYRLVYWSRPSAIGRSQEAHAAIYEAWSRRDPDATERAVAEHILAALWEITARIEPGRATSATSHAFAERHRVALPIPARSEDR